MKKAANIIFIILTIILAVVIFLFSSDTGDESGSKSSRVTRIILSVFIRGFGKLGEEEKGLLIEKYSFIVRKMAHFSEYAALAFLLYGSFYTSNISFRNNRGIMILIPWLLSTIYASTDELHQMFVAGRGPSVRDVVIDSSGSLFGALFFTFITLIISLVVRRKKSQ